MDKKSNPPKKPAQPGKSTGGMRPGQSRPNTQPARPVSTGRPPNLQRAGPPPRPMVTAQDRRLIKEQRRAANAFTPPPVTPAPAAGATADALQLEVDRFNSLQNRLVLSQVNDDLEDIETAVNALPANVENVRARGYIFKSYLEKKVETLQTQWRDLRPRVEQELRTRQADLARAAGDVQNRLNRRQLAGPALSALESKVGAAITGLQGMYDTLDDNVNQTQQQLDDISWTLQQCEQACYSFLPTEAAVEAVPANWKKPGDKDGVDGVLVLTDQRLIFEQKEEIATKKVLFITTEKQKVQSLAWETPVAQIEKAAGAKKGFMGKDDFLTVTLPEGASFKEASGQPHYDDKGRPLREVELHLKGESGEAWQAHIGRVRSGDIARERTVPVDQAAQEAVANAPTKCPNCGATLTQKIMRGQTEITCEFCGSVIRL